MTCIMEVSVERLVDSPHNTDFLELLKLRFVCKTWRNSVDNAARTHFKDVLQIVQRGIKTRNTADVIAARDKVLGSGLSTIAVIQDSVDPIGPLNYMRVKSIKRPGSLPPTATFHGQ